jgi:short-subunit dehydrogenase
MTEHHLPVVVITGATAGVGRATAQEFARRGYQVAFLARGGLEQTRADLEQVGASQVLALEADVADAEAVEQAAARVEAELGPIEVWVNVATTSTFAPFDEVTAEEFRRITEVTYLGYVHGTMAALRRMKPRDRGTIVQVGSALAYRSIPLQSAYCGAKAAIRGFTDSIRTELIHDKSRVRLTMVQLPAHNTPQFDWTRNKMDKRAQPVPPIYQPEVAARAIYRAAHEAPRELWVGKTSIQAILGTMVAPGLLDRMMATRAYEGQFTQSDKVPGQPDNLEQPVEGLHSTHGRFDDRSSERAFPIVSDTTARLAVAAVGAGLAALALGAVGRRRRPGSGWPPHALEGRHRNSIS